VAKLWQKENQTTDAKIEAFTIGNDPVYDLQLAQYDVWGSLAHIAMLTRVGTFAQPRIIALTDGIKTHFNRY